MRECWLGREKRERERMGVAAKEEVGYAEKLVAVNRYNPDILPDLETHVNHQVPTYLFFFFTKKKILLFNLSLYVLYLTSNNHTLVPKSIYTLAFGSM